MCIRDRSIWEVLAAYQRPSPLGDSVLEQRAFQAKIIEPIEQAICPQDLKERFDEVSKKVLKYRKVEAHPDLRDRIAQLAETCQPVVLNRPLFYFVWHDPTLVFNVMLEHFRVYLETEFTTSQTSDSDTVFLEKSLGRPPRQESLEQQVCTLDTAWRRAKHISQKLSPESRVLVIGDDDLVSIALSRFPTKVIDVLELDSCLVRLLKKNGGERLRVFRRDLSDGLPEDFARKYDAVISDPMYSKEGMSMFLGCCEKALKPGPSSRLFLTTYPPLLEDSAGFFELLKAKGLKLLETHKNFSRYPFPNDMRAGALEGLAALGYHPKLSTTLLDVPYLYAHLFECRLEESS